MGDLLDVAVVAAIAGAGMIVGSMFAFSAFIMAAFRRLEEAEGIRAMQRINETVYTPWFMVPFFGTTLLSIGVVVFASMHTDHAWWPTPLAAGLVFVVGVFGVTAVGNVPLNERLACMEPSDAASSGFWQHYLVVWTRWNHLRVGLGVISIILYSSMP